MSETGIMAIRKNRIARLHAKGRAEHIVPGGIGEESGAAGDDAALTDVPLIIRLRRNRRSHFHHCQRRFTLIRAIVDRVDETILTLKGGIGLIEETPSGIRQDDGDTGNFRSHGAGLCPQEKPALGRKGFQACRQGIIVGICARQHQRSDRIPDHPIDTAERTHRGSAGFPGGPLSG